MTRPTRHGSALRGSSPALVAPADGHAPFTLSSVASAHRRLLTIAVVFVLCAAGLWVLHQQTRPHYRLSAADAIAAARANASDREFLAHHPTNSARVIPLDAMVQRVTFFDGPRVVLDAAVGEHGEVVANEEHVPGVPASGAALANSPWVLGLLSVLFLLATLVIPLRRIQNLDALVLASLTLTVPLINARLIAASVICATPALCYLMVRCLLVGLKPGEARTESAGTPLLDWLWAGWEPERRTRMLRLLVLATILAFLMITLTSSGYTDVAAASLNGATDILHGVMPYGHIHLAFHGDTYPLLNYLLYVPAALWLPVSNGFSDLMGSLVTTAVASLLVGWALYRIAGSRKLGGTDGPRTDDRLRSVLMWFAFPPVLLAASGGANDLVLAACLAWMLALRTRTAASLLALAMGIWVKLVPLILLAIWIPYRRRGLWHACAAGLVLSAALTALLLLLGGTGAISAMVHAISFQFQRGSFFAPWYTFHLLWLQPPAQALVLAIVVASVLCLRADRSARTDLIRLSALAAALLLGVQLAANYWTWSYLPWVFPFLAVALFMPQREVAARPRMAERQEPSGLALLSG
jgi:Glycosyltransferase family 87